MLDKALAFATEKHKGQVDDSGKPYINHPIAVAEIVRCVTKDEEVIAAAFLHDVLEDTDATYEELKSEFGFRVADLVNEVTKEGKNFFPRLHTQRAVLLKLADRMHNISRMEPWTQERQDKYIRNTVFWGS